VTTHTTKIPERQIVVYVANDEDRCWAVVCRNHFWLHGDFWSAFVDAREIARGFGALVRIHAGEWIQRPP
jgi:hypothetical protein